KDAVVVWCLRMQSLLSLLISILPLIFFPPICVGSGRAKGSQSSRWNPERFEIASRDVLNMCFHPQTVEKTFDVLAAARCCCRKWAGPTFCFVTSFRPATNRGARAWLPLAAAHTPTNQ